MAVECVSIFVHLSINPFPNGHSAGRKSGTSRRVGSFVAGDRRPVFCVGSNPLASESSSAEQAIGDQSVLCWRISLIEQMIAK